MIALAPTMDAVTILISAPVSPQMGVGLQPTAAPMTISAPAPSSITLVSNIVTFTVSLSMPRLTVGGPFAASGRRILSLFRDNRLAPVTAE
jgi:hypothetical protein